YDPFHPGVLRVLWQIAEACRAAGKSASICGEVAGDHWFTPILLGLGYRELSMAPVFLPRVKLMLRSFSLEECQDLASRALAMHATSAVRKLVLEEIQPRWAAQLRSSDGSQLDDQPADGSSHESKDGGA
ncbi:MAG: phosphoenolpyruvate-protein kinase (PTS system EI component), partial [Planctomycetota bacterium]